VSAQHALPRAFGVSDAGGRPAVSGISRKDAGAPAEATGQLFATRPRRYNVCRGEGGERKEAAREESKRTIRIGYATSKPPAPDVKAGEQGPQGGSSRQGGTRPAALVTPEDTGKCHMRPRVRFLSDGLVEQILDEAYMLLETRGINLNHDPLLERLAQAGCRIDRDGKRAWLPRDVVEGALRSVPRGIELWNIAGSACCDLSGDNVHFTPGSTAIRILDYRTNRMRPVSSDDMLRYCRLVEQLDAIDYSATAVVPADVPKAIGDSIRLYALLKTTGKAIVTGAFTIDGSSPAAQVPRSSGAPRRPTTRRSVPSWVSPWSSSPCRWRGSCPPSR
jgi:hypothetical protein